MRGRSHGRGSLAAATAGVDDVYHIAAIYRQAGIPASEYRAVNVDGVGALVRASAAAGVRRVVHCSTVGVHGDIEHPPANEDAPLRPGDIYQETKVEGERVGPGGGGRGTASSSSSRGRAASTAPATAACSSCSAASRGAGSSSSAAARSTTI